jgi:hypothetical protein
MVRVSIEHTEDDDDEVERHRRPLLGLDVFDDAAEKHYLFSASIISTMLSMRSRFRARTA